MVEVGNVLSLDTPTPLRGRSRAERILAAARPARGAFDILCIHADGAGDANAAWLEQVSPALLLLDDDYYQRHERAIGVVPIREIEAWALADGDALRRAFGTVHSDQELGLPSKKHEVEGILDPKAVLEQMLSLVVGGGRRRKSGAAGFLAAIGAAIRLEQLRDVPSFTRFERDLQQALEELGYVQP